MNNLILFIILLILPYDIFSQQNVDINEGFEGSWLPSGWQASSFSQSGTMNHTSGGSNSAVHGVSINSTATITSSYFQVINGESFDTISFWLRHSAVSLSGSISADITGNNTNSNLGTINLDIVPQNTWVKYSYPYSVSQDDSAALRLSITHTLALGNMFIDDFRIHKSLVLPVELSYFTHVVKDNNVTLKWQTLWEINNAGFDIERADFYSTPPGWEKITFITGRGTINEPSDYSFIDYRLNSGKYLYRIKQIDYNSNYKYYALASPILVEPPADYLLEQNYPNPTNPNTKINYRIPADGNVSIKVYEISGKESKYYLKATRRQVITP